MEAKKTDKKLVKYVNTELPFLTYVTVFFN